MSSTEKNILNDEKNVLVNVLKTISGACHTEGENQALTIPITEPENRITFYTGLTHSEIERFYTTNRFPNLDLNSRIIIHETVCSMLVREGSLDYVSLFREVKKRGGICNSDQIRKIFDFHEFVQEMYALGYMKKKTILDNTLIIEDPEVRFERFYYLTRIKKVRTTLTNWNQIVYIDERVINVKENKFQKIWPPSEWNADTSQTIFYHAVSAKSGFINGLFSNQVTHQDFCKWVTDILLGHLKEPSLIILNNNPLHGVPQSKCPITKYDSKTKMLKWLAKHHIPCTSAMDKPSLYELVRKFSDNSVEYKIDSIIRAHGHDVLRLPRFLYDLSMTTLLWEYAKNVISSKKDPFELKTTLLQLFGNLEPVTWNQFEKTIEKEEKDILITDYAIDKHIENLEFKID